MPPDRAGEGAPPKSLIFANCWRTSRAQISHNLANPETGAGIVGGLPGLPSHLDAGLPWVFSILKQGRARRDPFPKSFILGCIRVGSRANYATIPAACRRGAKRSGFPKNLIVGGASSMPGSDASQRFPGLGAGPQASRAGGSSSPISFILASVGRPGDGRCGVPRFLIIGCPRFHIYRGGRQRFPQNLHNTAPDPSFYSPNPS
jgi:hypothetical protein